MIWKITDRFTEYKNGREKFDFGVEWTLNNWITEPLILEGSNGNSFDMSRASLSKITFTISVYKSFELFHFPERFEMQRIF